MVSYTPNTQTLLYNHMSFFTGSDDIYRTKIVKGTIAEYVYGSDFGKLVEKAGFMGLLNSQRERLTVFIPENIENVDTYDISEARHIVNCSILPYIVTSLELKKAPVCYFNTRNPEMRLFVVNRGNTTQLNCEANIIQYDIDCSNGFIHKIDNLLKPNSKHYVN